MGATWLTPMREEEAMNQGIQVAFRSWKVKVKSLSRVPLFVTLWTVAYQAPPPTGFSRQGYWSGLPQKLEKDTNDQPPRRSTALPEPSFQFSETREGNILNIYCLYVALCYNSNRKTVHTAFKKKQFSQASKQQGNQIFCSCFSITSHRKTQMNFLANPIYQG